MATLVQTDRALKDLIKRLDDQLTPAVQGVVSTQANAILKQRVFSNNGRAADGALTGKYKHKRYRTKNKKVGLNVNLQRTGSLFNSIKVGKFGKDTVLGFTNDKTLRYAKFNEERYRGSENTIFVLNEQESDRAFKAGQKAFDKIVDRWLQTF